MINETIGLLGRRAKDRVTGFEGVITSVCFDLYGCVQVGVTPIAGKDGKLGDSHWFDVQRAELLGKTAVMSAPDFAARAATIAEHASGPAEKPEW